MDLTYIAKQVFLTTQNPRSEWRREAPPLASWVLLTLAINEQTNHKKIFESVAKQHFQKFSWFGSEREALLDNKDSSKQ
jgi:hypothetical protein